MEKPKPLGLFVPIGPRMSLYTPPNAVRGELVILCSWLGASPKTIAKYTDLWHDIAPKSSILLIQSSVVNITNPYKSQRRQIQPAVKAVLNVLEECGIEAAKKGKNWNEISDSAEDLLGNGVASRLRNKTASPKILIHAFSNGGANSATQLLIALHSVLLQPLPIAGLVCDSCPAKGTIYKSYISMVYGLPKGLIIQLVGKLAIGLTLIALHTCIWIGTHVNPGQLMRDTLLDPRYVDSGSLQDIDYAEEGVAGRVVYIFSKEDRMTYWEDITDHAAEAREKGWETDEMLVEGSAHVGHLQKGRVPYVDALNRIWNGGKAWQAVRAKL